MFLLLCRDIDVLILVVVIYYRSIVGAGCAFSIISIIVLIVGVILDGIWSGVTESLDTCYDQEKGEFYGSSTYQIFALSCASGNSQTCLCVNSGNSDTCYLFDLESADNCGEILTTMPALLLTSLIFLLLLLVTMFIYSIFTCMNTCCNKRNEAAEQNPKPVPAAAEATSVSAVPMTNKV